MTQFLPPEELHIMDNMDQVSNAPCNSSNDCEIKSEVLDDEKFNIEDLHHSIDIKEEELPQMQPPKKSNSSRKFECAVCGYITTASKYALMEHLRIHTGEKPFACEICDYKCTRKNNLRVHLRTHTGEKPFVCEICQHKFSHKPNLNMHLRAHTGEKAFAEKRFVCEFCHHKFSHKASLNDHLRTHTGEKPFVCEFCHYKFSQKSSLRVHLKTRH